MSFLTVVSVWRRQCNHVKISGNNLNGPQEPAYHQAFPIYGDRGLICGLLEIQREMTCSEICNSFYQSQPKNPAVTQSILQNFSLIPVTKLYLIPYASTWIHHILRVHPKLELNFCYWLSSACCSWICDYNTYWILDYIRKPRLTFLKWLFYCCHREECCNFATRFQRI